MSRDTLFLAGVVISFIVFTGVFVYAMQVFSSRFDEDNPNTQPSKA